MFQAFAVALYTTNPWAVLGIGFAAGAGVAFGLSGAMNVARRRRRGAVNG